MESETDAERLVLSDLVCDSAAECVPDALPDQWNADTVADDDKRRVKVNDTDVVAVRSADDVSDR